MATKTATNTSAAVPVAGESRNGSIGYPTRGAALAMWEAFSKAKGEIDLEALSTKQGWSIALARFHHREWKLFNGLTTRTPRAAKKAAAKKTTKKAPAKKAA